MVVAVTRAESVFSGDRPDHYHLKWHDHCHNLSQLPLALSFVSRASTTCSSAVSFSSSCTIVSTMGCGTIPMRLRRRSFTCNDMRQPHYSIPPPHNEVELFDVVVTYSMGELNASPFASQRSMCVYIYIERGERDPLGQWRKWVRGVCRWKN